MVECDYIEKERIIMSNKIKKNKTTYVRMRVTEEKKQQIKNYCKKNNISISELLEHGLSCVMNDDIE